MPTEPIQLDDILLIRKIATGGMAELWEGHQIGVASFEKRLAVKLILEHLAQDEEFVRLFLDEARLAAKLNHTNICQIYKLGEVYGRHYIAMDFIDGENVTSLLRQAARRKTFVPFGFVCQIMLGVCAALGYAHALETPEGKSLGIVHRDLSPPNVMVTKDGHIKVIDFGIAKAATQTHHTPADIMRGKFAYMSPEYVFEEVLDARSDIFSMGIVFWELTTGRRLFQADTEYAKMLKITRGNYPRPSAHRKDIPPQLEDIIMRALSFSRQERYPSCAAMQEDIELFLLNQNQALNPSQLAAFLRWLFSESTQPPPTPRSGAYPTFPMTAASPQTHRVAPEDAPPPDEHAENPDGTASSEFDKAPSTPSYTTQARLLIADDHKQIRNTLHMILTAQGYHVTTAQDGLEALEQLKAGPYDVCLLDLNMPKLNGQDTLKQIRRLCPSLPCIIQTSDSSFQTAMDMGRSGAFSYLVKPVKSKELIDTIEKARQHCPAGEELDQTVLALYPTPIAELFHQYQTQPLKTGTLRHRHALLASQFELYAAWVGSLELAAYIADGAFSPLANYQIQQTLHQHIQPKDWFHILDLINQQYTQNHQPHFSRTLRDLLLPTSWQHPLDQARMQALCTQLAPSLMTSLPEDDLTPQDALQLLAQYHQEYWRNDTLLSHQELTHFIACIAPFIRSLYRQMHRLIDFSLISIDAVEETQYGIHHEMTHMQGLTTKSTSQLLPESLALHGLYLFNFEHTPLFPLFPFLIAGPCQTHNCTHSGISHLVQLNKELQPTYQHIHCGHLQELKQGEWQRVQEHLHPLYHNDGGATHLPTQWNRL